MTKFDIFDTVEIEPKLSFKSIDKKNKKGYLIHCVSGDIENTFDIVILGYYNDKNTSYLGNGIFISLTRMVLIEKFDYNREVALSVSNKIMSDILNNDQRRHIGI